MTRLDAEKIHDYPDMIIEVIEQEKNDLWGSLWTDVHKLPQRSLSLEVAFIHLENDVSICFRNLSAIGVKLWYLFQIKYIFISRCG